MNAQNYICTWHDKKYNGGKELGDWTTEEVVQFANDFSRQCHPEFLTNIDWKLLREQKRDLYHIAISKNYMDPLNRSLNGILHLLDSLQDFAVDEMGISEEEVFDLNPEEE